MPPTLPPETIEHAISFLRENIPSLAACSLICRALLPISRVELWHEVVLPVEEDGSHSARTIAFIGVLGSNPALAPYVRSLALHPGHSVCRFAEVPLNRAALDTLSARLPALCSPRLQFLVIQSLYEVVTLIRGMPTLEALHLQNVKLAWSNRVARHVSVWPQQSV